MENDEDEHKKYTEALNWLVSDMLVRLNRIESKVDNLIEQKNQVNRPEGIKKVRDSLSEKG